MDGISWKRIDLEPDIESTSYATPIVQRLTANARKSDKNMEKLSGVMIIIMIGGSVLIAVLLFIFAKRQIMRFTLRSRRGPHVPVGNDAKKILKKEIERRLDSIQKISQEPKLLWTDDKFILQPDKPLPPYFYRMQAVDDIKILELEIAKNDGSIRHPHESLRAFLLTTLAATTLNGSGQRIIHQFCDMYEHARHDPSEFHSEQYEAYQRLLLKLIEASKQLKSFSGSCKSSPARTPKKATKIPPLLDPSRLRPPPASSAIGHHIGGCGGGTGEMAVGQQSKVNLTLGLQGRELVESCEIVTNPLHLQTPTERELIMRNRMKSSAAMDEISSGNFNINTTINTRRDRLDTNNDDIDEEDIINISSVHSRIV